MPALAMLESQTRRVSAAKPEELPSGVSYDSQILWFKLALLD